MRKSSAHIEQGHEGEFFHNDRSKPTTNSIFSIENNYYNLSGLEAIELYRKDIAKKREIFKKRVGRNLNKNTITLMSAIINLDKQHTKEDIEKVCKYLEESLDTKIYQFSIHRDEGHIDENGEKIINEHGHILCSGLDSEGRSVRKKLTKSYLINLQTEVAKILKMERGINYTQEQKKRPKRLDTYQYKEHAKREAEALKPIIKQKEKLKEENDLMLDYVDYNNRHFEEVEQENKFLNEELAKIKDFNKVNKEIREFLKSQGATRLDYANWEQVARELKERIKNKDLTISQLNEQKENRKKMFLEKIEELKKENKELNKKVCSNYSIKINNKIVPATWEQVANNIAKNFKKKIEENEKLKKEKEELEEELKEKNKIIQKLGEELNKVISKFNLEKNDNLLLTIKIISNALNNLKEELNNKKEEKPEKSTISPEKMMEKIGLKPIPTPENKPENKKLKEEADRIVNEIFDNNPFEDEYIAPTTKIKR